MMNHRRLQWLYECVARKNDVAIEIADHIEKLEKALSDIKQHQEIVAGDGAKLSATWNIANNALIEVRQ